MKLLKTDWMYYPAKSFRGGKYKIHLLEKQPGVWKQRFEYGSGHVTEWCASGKPNENRMEFI